VAKAGKPGGEDTCPRCTGKLLYDGRGHSCLSCSFTRRTPTTVKSIVVPKPKRKEK
jgi:hypothetical protein